MSYAAFLSRKGTAVAARGFDAPELLPALFPFQRDIVRWALARGRAALFCDTGLGKSLMQLEWARRVVEHTGGAVLVLAPLAVATQTVREGDRFGIEARYLRQDDGQPGIVVANYEMLGHFDASRFAGVVLDESSILKAFDGKTRTQIVGAFRQTPFRLACTATPAPNDFMELGNHAEFLGVMTRAEMLSMFFVHDGGSTQDWRIKGHAEDAFWRWVCRWAVLIKRPSDLGYEDGAFLLPPLNMHEHVVGVDHRAAWRSGKLFALEAQTLDERRAARRGSMPERVAKCAELVNNTPDQWLLWVDLNAEGDALEKAIEGAVQVAGADTRDHKERCAVDFAEGRIRVLISKPSIFGFGLNFQSCSQVAFVGLSDSYEAFYQAVRRVYRFGQKHAVDCHVITAETEGAVVANIQRKEREAQRMAEGMVKHMKAEMVANVRATARDMVEYVTNKRAALPAWLKSEVA